EDVHPSLHGSAAEMVCEEIADEREALARGEVVEVTAQVITSQLAPQLCTHLEPGGNTLGPQFRERVEMCGPQARDIRAAKLVRGCKGRLEPRSTRDGGETEEVSATTGDNQGDGVVRGHGGRLGEREPF